jgi:hypothetical protein
LIEVAAVKDDAEEIVSHFLIRSQLRVIALEKGGLIGSGDDGKRRECWGTECGEQERINESNHDSPSLVSIEYLMPGGSVILRVQGHL